MLVARALDEAWGRLGRPDPFLVVDAGGGRGRLLADVLRAEPACATAMRAVLVERSARLRAEAHELLSLEPPADALGPFVRSTTDEAPTPVPDTGPVVTALDELPMVTLDGVIIANELLDNLPVRIVERTGHGWSELRVGVDDQARFVEVLVDAPPELTGPAAELADDLDIGLGARLPIPLAAADWLAQTAPILSHGELWILDYADETAGLLTRGPGGAAGWLRTYRGHRRGTDPFDAPGEQDLTCDVPLAWLRRAATRAGFTITSESTQGDWLARLGVDALVDEGRRRWAAGAHLGDLQAVAGRSRAVEAAALTDPTGLGAHRVVVCGRATPAAGEPTGLTPRR